MKWNTIDRNYVEFINFKGSNLCNIDLTPVDVNPTPRPENLKPLSYLGSIALRKKFAASLIVNLYNSHIVGADMYHLDNYQLQLMIN